ncbi:MAG: hypothetical protein R2880_12200 [Deinococcales bacterium]
MLNQSLAGYALSVLDTCDRAVALAEVLLEIGDVSRLPMYRDTRGIALSLTDDPLNYTQATEDLSSFIDFLKTPDAASTNYSKAQLAYFITARQAIIDRLKQAPPTPEQIEELKTKG